VPAGGRSATGRRSWGRGVATAALSAFLALVVVEMALVGLLIGPMDIALFTVRQRRTDPAWTGRAFAVSLLLERGIELLLGHAGLACHRRDEELIERRLRGVDGHLDACAAPAAPGNIAAGWALPMRSNSCGSCSPNMEEASTRCFG
jgi:hypothetical protein